MPPQDFHSREPGDPRLTDRRWKHAHSITLDAVECDTFAEGGGAEDDQSSDAKHLRFDKLRLTERFTAITVRI